MFKTKQNCLSLALRYKCDLLYMQRYNCYYIKILQDLHLMNNNLGMQIKLKLYNSKNNSYMIC